MQGSVAAEKSVGLSLGLEPVNQVLVSREPSAGLAVHFGLPITSSPPLDRVESWHCRSTGTATWTGLLPTVCQNIPSGASTTRTLPTPSHLATTSGNVAVEGTWCHSSICHWQLWYFGDFDGAWRATEENLESFFDAARQSRWDPHCVQTTAEGGGQ